MDQEDFKQALYRLGWTQRKAADELGTTQKTISFWCTGKHRVARWAVKLLNLIEQQADQGATDDQIDQPLYEQLRQLAQTNERYARRIEEMETTQRQGAEDVRMYRIQVQRAQDEASKAQEDLKYARLHIRYLEAIVNDFEAKQAQHARVDWSAYEPYFTLGIRPDSTPEQIKAARNYLSMVFHPDREAPLDREVKVEAQQRINAAYQQIKQKPL